MERDEAKDRSANVELNGIRKLLKWRSPKQLDRGVTGHAGAFWSSQPKSVTHVTNLLE
jgi:hypothetical protein